MFLVGVSGVMLGGTRVWCLQRCLPARMPHGHFRAGARCVAAGPADHKVRCAGAAISAKVLTVSMCSGARTTPLPENRSIRDPGAAGRGRIGTLSQTKKR
jgi:hypothetical protein